jgi:hypothetical protein
MEPGKNNKKIPGFLDSWVPHESFFKTSIQANPQRFLVSLSPCYLISIHSTEIYLAAQANVKPNSTNFN